MHYACALGSKTSSASIKRSYLRGARQNAPWKFGGWLAALHWPQACWRYPRHAWLTRRPVSRIQRLPTETDNWSQSTCQRFCRLVAIRRPLAHRICKRGRHRRSYLQTHETRNACSGGLVWALSAATNKKGTVWLLAESNWKFHLHCGV